MFISRCIMIAVGISIAEWRGILNYGVTNRRGEHVNENEISYGTFYAMKVNYLVHLDHWRYAWSVQLFFSAESLSANGCASIPPSEWSGPTVVRLKGNLWSLVTDRSPLAFDCSLRSWQTSRMEFRLIDRSSETSRWVASTWQLTVIEILANWVVR